MQYSKIKIAVGVFVTIVLLVITSSVYFILSEKGFFKKRFSYHFNIESAKSLNVGMPLEFSGFNIGTVDDISLNSDATVDITFSVDEDNKKWLRKGTFLKIVKPLIGSPYIEVDSNLTRAELLPNSILEITQSDDINDMISRLDPALKNIIKIIENIDNITSGESELMAIVKNVNKLTGKLANDKGLLTTITGDKKSTESLVSSLNELNEGMRNIQKITADVEKVSSSIKEDVVTPTSNSVKNLNAIMEDVKSKLEVLNGTVNSVGGYDNKLVDIKEEVSVAIEKSNQILEKVDAMIQGSSDAEVVLP